MSTTKKNGSVAEAAEEVKTTAATETSAEEKDKEFFAKLPDPCVYCGPSVRGVTQQFRVYNGGIPDALKEFIKEHRAAKGLIVSVERFAEMRKRLETPGTAEAILFSKVRSEL